MCGSLLLFDQPSNCASLEKILANALRQGFAKLDGKGWPVEGIVIMRAGENALAAAHDLSGK